MIELLPKWFESFGKIRVIYKPTERGITLPGHHDLCFEAMPVQTTTLVRLRQMWEQMGCFKLKSFVQFHLHTIMLFKNLSTRRHSARSGNVPVTLRQCCLRLARLGSS